MASFQFDARNADELSFVEGDVIEVDMNAPAEPECFYGSCKGRSGLFPQAYVAPYSEDNTPSPFIPVSQASTQSIPANVEVLQGRFHIIIQLELQALKYKPETDFFIEVVVSQYDFEGVEPKHMSFAAGTTIEVTEKQEDWWQGRTSDGKEGWFPSNRVEEKQKKIKATKKAPPFRHFLDIFSWSHS